MKREDNGTLINRLTDRIFSPVSMSNRYMILLHRHDDDVPYARRDADRSVIESFHRILKEKSQARGRPEHDDTRLDDSMRNRPSKDLRKNGLVLPNTSHLDHLNHTRNEMVSSFLNDVGRPCYDKNGSNRTGLIASKSVKRYAPSTATNFLNMSNISNNIEIGKKGISPLDTSGNDCSFISSRRIADSSSINEYSINTIPTESVTFKEIPKLGVQMDELNNLHQETQDTLERSKSFLRDLSRMKDKCTYMKIHNIKNSEKNYLDVSAVSAFDKFEKTYSNMGISRINPSNSVYNITPMVKDSTEYCIMKAINVVPQSIDKNDYKTSNFNDRFTLEDAENIPPNMQYTRDMRYNNIQDYEDNMYDRRAGEKGYNNKQILSNRPFNIPFKTEKETTIGSRRDKFNNKTPDNNKFFSFKEGQAPPSDGSRFQAKFDTRRMPEPTHFGILQDISVDENSFERHNKEGNREKEYNYHEKPLNDDFNMILRNEKSVDMRKSTSSKAIIFD